MSKTKLLIAFVSLLAISLMAVIFMAIVVPRRSVTRLLGDLATVEVGRTSIDDWRRKVEQTDHRQVSVTCVQHECGFTLQNSFLHKLHLAPLTRLAAAVRFREGIANEIYIWVEIADAPDTAGVMYPGTGITIHQSVKPPSCDQHYSSWIKPTAVRSWGIVTMDSCVLPEERTEALTINTACLTKLGGCKTPAEILPAVFTRLPEAR